MACASPAALTSIRPSLRHGRRCASSPLSPAASLALSSSPSPTNSFSPSLSLSPSPSVSFPLLSVRRSALVGAAGARRVPGAVTCAATLPPLAETELVAVRTESGALAALPAGAGLYAVHDRAGRLQYVGLSRRLAASVHALAQDLPDLCHAVKVAVVESPSRDALTAAWQAWMEEHVQAGGELPPGNEPGNATFTARRARPAKADLRLTPGGNKELNISLIELIDRVVKECKVVAFIKGSRTSPQCGFSHRVLTILNENQVNYETLDVLDEEYNPGLREAIKQYSQWPTIPQLYVNGEFVGGADILDEMVESGEIKKLLSV